LRDYIDDAVERATTDAYVLFRELGYEWRGCIPSRSEIEEKLWELVENTFEDMLKIITEKGYKIKGTEETTCGTGRLTVICSYVQEKDPRDDSLMFEFQIDAGAGFLQPKQLAEAKKEYSDKKGRESRK